MGNKGTARAIVVLCLAGAMLAMPAVAQQSRYSSGWRDPAAPAAAPAPAQPRGDGSLDRFIVELNRLIDDAEKARAADRRFIADLRDLARRYAWPWRTRVVFDDFGDGDYTNGPAWRATGGGFQVSAYAGLVTRYTPQAPTTSAPARRDDDGDLRRALLGTLLQQMTRQDRQEPKQQPMPPPAGPSQLALSAAVPNAFAIELSLGSSTPGTGRIEVGVTQGKSGLGYRLAYNPGASPSIELLRVGSRGVAVIEASRTAVKLEDAKLHAVQMTRDAAGELTVRVDGKEIFRIVDRAFRSAFDGVVILNKGGEYTLRSIAVYGAS